MSMVEHYTFAIAIGMVLGAVFCWYVMIGPVDRE